MSSPPAVPSDNVPPSSCCAEDEEDKCVAEFRAFIHKSKSLGCSPEETTSSALSSSKEAVSESFVDALTKQEIEELRQKLFTYWEKTMPKDSETEIEEPRVASHTGSDPKAQCEEAVTSFEDAKSENLMSIESIHDIAKLVEAELRKIREAKLSEGIAENPDTGKMRRSENMDFTELKKKAADLPGIADLASPKRHLPVPRKTDPLEMILRIYECSKVDSEGSVKYNAEKESIDISLVPKITKHQKFRKRLIVEMRLLYERLASQPRAHPIPEERETSSSSDPTKESSKDRSSSLPMSPLDSTTNSATSHYPEDTTRSNAPTPIDDIFSSSNSSVSGLINEPVFELPGDARKEDSSDGSSEGSSNKTETSSTTVCSEETLSEISSLPTDTTSGGARASLSSLRDAEGLPFSMSRPHLMIDDDEAFEDPAGSLDVPPMDIDAALGVPGQLGQLNVPGQPGQLGVPGQPCKLAAQLAVPSLLNVPGQLTVPGQLNVPGQIYVPGQLYVPALPLSLDSTEHEKADDRARRRRERSPRQDDDKNVSKRKAV